MNRTSSTSEAEFSLTAGHTNNNLIQFLENIEKVPYAKSTAPRTRSGKYSQNWKAYNDAQDNEKRLFRIILKELCEMVEDKEQSLGRPRIPLGDIIFSAAYMVYSNHSGRRFKTDLLELEKNGFVSKAPHRNSISNYLCEEWLTTALTSLIEISSLPLTNVEDNFAVDSTGLSTDRYARWVDDRTKEPKERREWVKLHIICGVKTNIVTSVLVTPGEASDTRQFGRLVVATKRNFTLKEISADAAYLSGENMRHAILAGALPFIKFKSNSVLDANYKSTPWKSLLWLCEKRPWVYMSYYNKRSNVEATFSMIKAKFGGCLRSIDKRAQINESLLKVLCHNICVLIQSFYELNIKISFPTEASVSFEHEHEDFRRISLAGGRIVGVIGGNNIKQEAFGLTGKRRKGAKKSPPKDQIPLFG